MAAGKFLYNRVVGWQEGKGSEIVWCNPAVLGDLQIADFSSQGAAVKGEYQYRPPLVAVVGCLENVPDSDFQTQFLEDFTAQTIAGGFVAVEFAPRELPHAGMGLSFGAAGNQDESVVADDGGSNDDRLHQLLFIGLKWLA